MKNLAITLLVFLSLVISPNLFAQNVSVNADGSLADTSAMLDVSSTTKGFLLPRMTTSQQNAIILPANGLTIFNTTLNAVMLNIGTPLSPNWSSLGIASAGWSITGNSGINPASNFLGTTDNKSLRFRTNNTQGMILDSLGNVSVGASTTTLDATNPEKFLVNTGTTTSVNAIVGKGSINSYLQLNIQNQSAGTNASSDVVATANNGNETSNYVDMGINGGSNTSGVMGVANDAYFYNLGQNLFIGTGTAAKSLIFMTGGTDSATNQRMRIDGNGNVGIGTAVPATALHVVKSNSGSNVLTLENSSASGYSSADFLNNSATLSGTFGYANAGTGGLFGGRDYFNSYTNDFLWTANSTSAAIFVKGSNSNVGIGTTAPATALHVYGTNPLTLTGVQLGTTTTADSVLTINSGTVQKLPVSTFSTPSNSWSINGNSGTTSTTNFIGTTDNKSFKIKTNNTQGILLDSLGNVGVGTTPTFDATNPEKFLVNAGTTTSVNAIVGKGSINSYLQLNIQNQSAGTNASSDVVATANNGNETSNYMDMGINGGSNTSGVMGVADDAYLYNLGQNLFIGTGTAAKSLIFMTGGTDSATNGRMRIDGNGNVGIGTSTFNGTNPERLLVDAGTNGAAAFQNVIVGKGNTNSYAQLNIQNTNAGTAASSDVVATADNGNETSNYIDMGINSGSNTSGYMGVKNDAYLYNLGQNLFIGTGTAAKSLIFMTGGTDSATNGHVRIDGNGNVGIGTASPNSTLQNVGSLSLNIVSKSTNYTAAATDHTIVCTSGSARTITLPTASGITGRIYVIKRTGAGTVTVATTSSQTIDGVTTASLATQYNEITVQSDGSNWIVLSN